jgi:hypothetical protein
VFNSSYPDGIVYRVNHEFSWFGKLEEEEKYEGGGGGNCAIGVV